ncbi:hypothetical protein [Micromonospora sp. WMMB235]|uniref:hypothetical protein n=1 Tax=Micromonospora sp. WMMB235 TaxID=1172030 RepID=UPI0008DAC006|nr:hypothetical protein [Micromonospora sp. WMMB235]OHX01942.1 hypothetical protein BFV98_02550 [Micromonospora sp. WMMB235]
MRKVGCSPTDVEHLACAVRSILGSSSTWRPMPLGYPDALALCVIDAIWSMGVNYRAVENVVDRYRSSRRAEGGDPDRDRVSDLLQHYDRIGGPEEFATQVKNRQRASTRPGAALKATAIHRAALGLLEMGIETCEELCAAAGGPDEARMKSSWRAVPGQGSGISWRYLLMLAGTPGVKPDRMIRRFVARTLGGRTDVAPDTAACLVVMAAELLDVSPTSLDHEIWRYERRGRRRRPEGG